MIRNIADIIKAFSDEERAKLDAFEVEHRPTIGAMYEGLTNTILEKSIPVNINLKIVSGVIFDCSGDMTGQIDCMLVEGEGEKIPYTDLYKWHVKDVICVFEVKKNLYSKDLNEAFFHLRKVLSSYFRYLESGFSNKKIDISNAQKAFSMMTGNLAPEYHRADSLDFEEQHIFHTLLVEQMSPVRIIFGYHGFKSEYSFRESMVNFIESHVGEKEFGVTSFPQLVICGDYSLLKANGFPYCPTIRNGYWDFYLSSSDNPIIFIIELIWTKLRNRYPDLALWDDDLSLENMNFFIRCKPMDVPEGKGWEYRYEEIPKSVLENIACSKKWEPVYLDDNQYLVLNMVCSKGRQNIKDFDFLNYLKKEGISIDDFISTLLKTGLFAMDDNDLVLIAENCTSMILPSGDIVAAENNTGRLTKWLKEYYS